MIQVDSYSIEEAGVRFCISCGQICRDLSVSPERMLQELLEIGKGVESGRVLRLSVNNRLKLVADDTGFSQAELLSETICRVIVGDCQFNKGCASPILAVLHRSEVGDVCPKTPIESQPFLEYFDGLGTKMQERCFQLMEFRESYDKDVQVRQRKSDKGVFQEAGQ